MGLRRDLLDPGIKTGSPALQVDSLLSEPPGNPVIRGSLPQNCCIHFTLLRGNLNDSPVIKSRLVC